ncbi:uncharacterized protein LOC128551808 [Mercenaria mercenaria]|uniref:uncharacterized protein LOC128551808 n=1 Tax=Mercenaria mercenaria TaxID=6596 RepID=UPI00234E7A27|nr:uncharacterized protein LOC128551808 [Mercenaria mercenaria]
MSDKLKEFVLKRGIGPAVLQRLVTDKIDCSVMLLMDDNTLKSYLPAYGDRVSTIAFCRSQTEGDQCSNALNELRGKWKKERSTLHSCGFKAGNAYAERTIRRLELGWMDYSNQSMCYKQVRQRCGGGVRHLMVEKTLSLKAVLNHALDAFFPSRISQRGILQEFETELKDFQGMCVNMENTINELYIESKLKILRVYLYTKKKTEKANDTIGPIEESLLSICNSNKEEKDSSLLKKWVDKALQPAEPQTIVVQWERLLQTMLRVVGKSTSNWLQPLRIVFSDEDGDDQGGSKREYLWYISIYLFKTLYLVTA